MRKLFVFAVFLYLYFDHLKKKIYLCDCFSCIFYDRFEKKREVFCHGAVRP